mmetsp:Transcript_22371/g.66309  ORF Transcript_22371/g.66309 Transcript_22371/m.66309 type:complete len:87 (-) Transcript_22371:471-731(-)
MLVCKECVSDILKVVYRGDPPKHEVQRMRAELVNAGEHVTWVSRVALSGISERVARNCYINHIYFFFALDYKCCKHRKMSKMPFVD